MDLSDLRKEYKLKRLLKMDLSSDPFEQLQHWFQDAQDAKILEPNAMALSTVGKDARPSCRMVLLKHFDKNGLYFFTNECSRKAIQLNANEFAAALFFWKELERQIQIEGEVEKASKEISDTYFHKRPRSSQIAAWASKQSESLSSREELEARFSFYETQFKDSEIPVPDRWTGYLLKPLRMEFWQGRESRLHDRFLYLKQKDSWTLGRLFP